MPALPPLTFKGGLNTSPMTAGQDDLAACKNVFYYNGILQKRGGVRYSRIMLTPDDITELDLIYFGVGTAAAEPGTVYGAAAGVVTKSCAATDDTIYMASLRSGSTPASSRAMFFSLGNDTYSKTANASQVLSRYRNPRDLIVEVWNSVTSAWVACKWFPCFESEYSSGSVSTGMAFPVDIGGSWRNSTMVNLEKNIRGVIIPTAGTVWGPKVIGGVNGYWFRLRGFGATLYDTGSPGPDVLRVTNVGSPRIGGSIQYSASGNAFKEAPRRDVKCLLYFVDRNNRPHEFAVNLNFSSSENSRYTYLGYQLDGTTLVQTDALRPDTLLGGHFSQAAIINAFYHPPTDRVIGFAQGADWFYAVTNGNKEVYAFFPSKDGANTAYASLPGGLRSVIPDGTISAFHDGRIWTTFGPGSHKIAYSAPGVYADIWPNDFELDIADASGPITGMCSLNGVLVAFKKNAIYTVYASGDSDAYQFDKVPGSFGCIASKSIVVVGNIAIFLGRDGLYAFDGQQVKLISDKVHGLFNSPSFSSAPQFAMACYFAPRQQYRLFYPSPVSTNVCDAGLYVDIGGLIGGGDGPPAFWPQGKYVATDYGFDACAVAVDETGTAPRMMIGDTRGVIWEHDFGVNDPTENVKASLTSARIGLGASRRNLVRFVTPTMIADSNLTWTLSSLVDADKENEVTDDFTAQGDNADAVFYSSSEVFVADATYDQLLDVQEQRSSDLKALGRFIQLSVAHEAAAPMSLTSVEIIVQPYGKGQF